MVVNSSRWLAALLSLGMAFCLWGPPLTAQTKPARLGIFEGQTDVGSVRPPGRAVYDAAKGTYTITAAGANIWSTEDGFHFVWTKASGDMSLAADIRFAESSGSHSPYRKAVLMFRQSLDADGVYADAASHGSGMTALQYRRAKGAATEDIELNIGSPERLKIEKRGDLITMLLSMHGEPLHPVGASIKLHLEEPFYAGIGVSAHNQNRSETAVFSQVELKTLPPQAAGETALYSTLKTIGIGADRGRAVAVYSRRALFEAPNWSPDGKYLLFDGEGKIWKIPVAGGTPTALDIEQASHCNGSHGFSPDGKWLAISCSTPGRPGSRVYVVPAAGVSPRVVTENPNSYWHSWSPDGKTIIFTRPQKGGAINIYSIPAEGGAEKALTTGTGTNDDPNYSPDGKYIYFNSDRSGHMQIWRMHPDGSHAEQITSDERANWTAHPSPDGKWIVYISYDKGVTGHPANKEIELRLISLSDKKVSTLVKLTGGSGTMNVPSWSPDSLHLAFVSYQFLPVPEGAAGKEEIGGATE